MRKLLLTVLLCAGPALADDALFAEAKEAVARSFKDPYSAVFEGLYLSKAADGSAVVCGTVNAKNSYGGFTGRKRFYYAVKSKVSDVPNRGDAVLKALCG